MSVLQEQAVLSYKCPCCGGGLTFDPGVRELSCPYCDNTFDLETVQACQESESGEDLSWSQEDGPQWSQQEQQAMQLFQCPSCAGELLCDAQTAATFCPFCGSPTLIPSRFSGGLRPDGLIPFATTKDDAKAAFLRLCKGKPLLPKFFTQEQQLEKITGIYVPFWLYDCDADFDGSYRATRLRHWSDSDYDYTRTDHYLLRRGGEAAFWGIPMDGSTKMDDAFMESIEPFDYQALTDFDPAYLSGFLADKYDVSWQSGEARIRQRVNNALEDAIQPSLMGYASVLPAARQLHIRNSKARYALLPVWLLNTRYRGKVYTFAMNGQTGRMTGTLPICPKRTAAWFAGIFAGAAALTLAFQWFI